MAIVKDLVCGVDIDTDSINEPVAADSSGAPRTDPTKGTKRFHEGEWYYFHNLDCRMKFISAPQAYLGGD